MLTREELVVGEEYRGKIDKNITRTVLAIGSERVFYKWTSESGGAGESTMKIDTFLENNVKTKPRIQGWVNIYKWSDGRFFGGEVHATKEEAEKQLARDEGNLLARMVAACVYIDVEEGEGV